MAENSPDILKTYTSGSSRNSKQDKHKKMHRHMVKVPKHKRGNLEISKRETIFTYQGTPIRLIAEFSAAVMEARRQWGNVFKELKEKNYHQPRIVPFKSGGQIKTFPDIQKTIEFVASQLTLPVILKKVLWAKSK